MARGGGTKVTTKRIYQLFEHQELALCLNRFMHFARSTQQPQPSEESTLLVESVSGERSEGAECEQLLYTLPGGSLQDKEQETQVQMDFE